MKIYASLVALAMGGVRNPCDAFTVTTCGVGSRKIAFRSSMPVTPEKKLYMSDPPQDNEFSSNATSGSNGKGPLSMPDIDMIKFDLEAAKVSGQKAIDSVQGNMQQGEFGERGEQFVIAQFFLIFCFLGGGLPIVGDFLYDLFGPILLLSGVLVAGTAVVEIEEGLTPFPVTNEKSKLRTTGIYKYIRHPMYTGVLMTLMGGSITTDSASRVLLTIGLYGVLYAKAEYEEKDLMKVFPGYISYKEEVRGTFLPAKWTDKLVASLNLEKKLP
jgi:protein-S-isoprenylcysteine O-methyltransferase Ste14